MGQSLIKDKTLESSWEVSRIHWDLHIYPLLPLNGLNTDPKNHTTNVAVSLHLFHTVIFGTDLVQLAADLHFCYSAVFLNCKER